MSTAARTAWLGAVVALLLAAAWFLLPTALGGGTTYVSTYGTSMEPALSTGDLAVLRPADSYEEGDVVAFDSRRLGTTVVHRIVDREGDRFVTQGDGNAWRDEDQPAAEELHGALWLTVPHGGTVLGALRSPWALGALGVLVTVIAAVVAGARRPAARTRPGTRPAGRRPRRLSLPRRSVARRVAAGAAALCVVAVTGAGALLLLPETQATSRGVAVNQEGDLTYTGVAVRGATYPDGRVTTGDPVWTALAHVVTLSYEQTLTSAGDLHADGTLRLALELTAPDGWRTELPGGSAVPLRSTRDGATATATVELNTAVASGLLTAHYDEVGTDGGPAAITVTPELDVDGTVDGAAFAAPPPAPVLFTIEPTALRLAGETATLGSTGGTTVTVEGTEPRVFSLGGLSVPLETARALALWPALATALVAVVASWLGAARGSGPASDLAVRCAGRVLPVARFVPEGTVVDVVPDALHRVATRLDALVLHSAGADGDTFAVRDGDTTYRCVIPPAAVPSSVPAPARVLRGRLATP
jgi:signal peptidase I